MPPSADGHLWKCPHRRRQRRSRVQALAEDAEACALLMFPTKALAQDQRTVLRRMLAAAFPADPPAVDVYDGDTPSDARAAIRARARLLVTNPDMLHQSMLPVRAQFDRFLANLRYVVVDEGHMYKGAFGCHVAAVLRRLRRICAREYGHEPVFAVASATSARPQEHVCALLGVDAVHVVSDDGSPHGPRLFALWNPPLLAGKGGGAPLPAEAVAPPRPGPGRLSHTESRVRGLELRRAKQEAIRQAARARNAARTGAYWPATFPCHLWVTCVHVYVQTASLRHAVSKHFTDTKPPHPGGTLQQPA